MVDKPLVVARYVEANLGLIVHHDSFGGRVRQTVYAGQEVGGRLVYGDDDVEVEAGDGSRHRIPLVHPQVLELILSFLR